MKILFIKTKQKKFQFKNFSKKEIAKIPKKLFLVYSIQYEDLAFFIKKQLEKNKIKIIKIKQVLGCSKINTKLPVLLIGTGTFHLLNLYLQSPEIFKFEDNKIIKIPNQEIQRLKNHKKSALIRFLSADNIGILVSTKPGQENFKQAINLKQKFEKKGKKAFIFISNNINVNQFENFNIDSWVNTACLGLSYDNPRIINYNEIPNLK